MKTLINTLCYVGYLRPAPGTWGSLAAIPLAWALHLIGGFPLLAAATVGVSVLAVWSIGAAVTSPAEDPAEIVIDEVAGQWLALWPVSLGAQMAGAGFWDLYPGVIAAFVMFRLFDIWKPGPIGWADRRGGAGGIVLDDLIAGAFAAVTVAGAAALAHGLLM